MNWKEFEAVGWIAVTLIVAMAAEVAIVALEGSTSLVSLGLPAVILVLGGALAGVAKSKP